MEKAVAVGYGRPSRGVRMKLATAHKVLISAAIVMGLAFSLWSFGRWSATGDASNGVGAVFGLGATVALAVYLRRFIRRSRDAG